MEAEYIRPITTVEGHNYYDILVTAIKGDFELYTVLKNDITVYYDYCEIQICPDTHKEQLTVQKKDESKFYARQELITLSIAAVTELGLNKKINGNSLSLVYPPPTNDHKLHSFNNLDVIGLDDVYVDTRTLTKTSKNKSPRARACHTQAIETAIVALGKEALNENIYKWIKNKTQGHSGDNLSFMNYLDFEDDDIADFSVPSQIATILKSNGKGITKQAFQDACAKARARARARAKK
jgi:hypothetical protein